MSNILPIVGQLSGYRTTDLRSDLAAGVTVGVMLIPQGMAYALVAGLPPIYGLYAALVPIAVYALLGSSRQLAVGPVAMVSLLVATSVAPLAGGDPDRYLQLALILSLLTGLIQLVLGLARFGFLTSFLSHPVLTGFTGAAAIIIGSSQLKHVLGIDLIRSEHALEVLWNAATRIAEANSLTLLFGVSAILVLVLLRRVSKRLPGALIVVVLGIVSARFLAGDTALAVVGDIPAGLPGFLVPAFAQNDILAMIPAALTISLVGFMESIAIAKSMATRHRHTVDSNTELRALGAANIAGAFFQAFPTTGGLSRTAVNDQAGAKTMLAGLIAALVVALVLAFLTPLFYHLPNAILGAIILVAVSGLFDLAEFRRLWRVKRSDFSLAVVTFAATLLVGVETGILVGVVASLALLVHSSSRPHTAVLGRLRGSDTFRNVERNPDAEVDEKTVLYRIDASIYFANIDFIADQVLTLAVPGVQDVVLDLYPVNRIDSTGAHGLQEILGTLVSREISLGIAGLKGPVQDVLRHTGILEGPNAPQLFPDVATAVEAIASRRPSALSPGIADASGSGSENAADRTYSPEEV